MKKILCISYSQSGQLDEILDHFTQPLGEFQIERVKVFPEKDFPFPWDVNNFYDLMPETVLEEPIPLKPFELKEDSYDLIIFGYQPWFLSPSLPATSILKHPSVQQRLKNTPVVTVIGSRNMWLNAQVGAVKMIEDAGGFMVGNLALKDRVPNQISAITIVHWMMTGKKTRKWGIFPKPGVSDEDIRDSSRFGEMLRDALLKDDLYHLQQRILAGGGSGISTGILYVEGKAKKIFLAWVKIIKKKEAEGKNRAFWISFFRIYLNTALFGVAPILLLFYTLLVRPFTQKSIRMKKLHYQYLGMKMPE